MEFDSNTYKDAIFKITKDDEFLNLALTAFFHQYQNNSVYYDFCNLLNINPKSICKLEDIPFLPIEFFKTKEIITGKSEEETIFVSSGTTGITSSHHYVSDLQLYESSFLNTFISKYGNPKEIVILGLLPSYLERGGSSLVYMVDKLIHLTGNSKSGFYLYDFQDLFQNICELENKLTKYILIGVSYALLDFAEKYKPEIKNGIVMETGGMKGQRKELTKAELHSILCKSFKTDSIHSEYGMTELLSQAYSQKDGIFNPPAHLQILTRDYYDPLSVSQTGTGAINIIDLANINSCCFIATSDLGTVYSNRTFSISGRLDNADIRGCNLLAY
jgi:phenylacetate-coenzyme A ligase PaaK-like adenylate-forming protein